MNRRYLNIALLVAALAVAVYTNLPQRDADTRADQPFDFYVLALSWSPAFCQSEAGQRSRTQCGPGADYGFITHGLWPQFEQGWPSFCQSSHGTSVPDRVADDLFSIMPDRGLIEHQWDKHGTCSGLSQADYAALTRQASQAIAMPASFAGQTPARLDADEIERDFVAANPNLSTDGIAVNCPSGRFTEIRICLTSDLQPRACSQVNNQGCQQSGLTIVPR